MFRVYNSLAGTAHRLSFKAASTSASLRPSILCYVRYKSTRSSTSAIEYKSSHIRRQFPPLPTPTPTAEEAVTNILYNTPAPSAEPEKRHVLNCLVQNEPGVLSRVSGILAARGFNIDSLVVARTEVTDLSRMTIVLRGQDNYIEQARRQLLDLVPVWAVLDYTQTIIVEREMLLVKVSILGPEHIHDRPSAGSDEEEFMPEADLAEESPDATSVLDNPIIIDDLTPSAGLRQKHAHLQSLSNLAKLFGAKLVDISSDRVIIELSAKPRRIDAFLELIRPFGILETARSGE
ncbi:5543_t:CDS:2 [Paraglomus occultum]|uniref:5543_t:CDS:1 n=1 Tax=Paraglomus occultum TaxID=144539 RepID=A0A9N9BKW0_9GLOM|nr:5543_t:CDS:2 [Paraglomus occultum]